MRGQIPDDRLGTGRSRPAPEAVGAGVQLLSEDVTADTLGTAVAQAVERAPRARELRDEIRGTGGIAASADAVERLA